LAALTQEDISRVSSIYFTQEMLQEETKEEQETTKPRKPREEAPSKEIDRKRTVQFQDSQMANSLLFSVDKLERMTKTSKTSIQL
jgi:hypothetical protein